MSGGYIGRGPLGSIEDVLYQALQQQPIKYKGYWTPNTIYNENDLVQTTSGAAYIVGVQHTSGADFNDNLDKVTLLAGSITVGGVYDNTTTYLEGQIIEYQGGLYLCEGTTTGNLPTDTNFWKLITSDLGRQYANAVDITGGDIVVDNLGTTNVTSDLIPDTDLAYDLGSATNRWNDIYLAGNSIFLGDATISSDGTSVTVTTGDNQTFTLNADGISSTAEIQLSDNLITTTTLNASLRLATIGNGSIELEANTNITGNLDVTGDITLGGNITIGDQNVDTVNVVADFTSNLIPSSNNTYDLGNSTDGWKKLYIEDIEANSGALNIDSNVITNLTSINVFNDTATTVNFAGAGTAITIGSNNQTIPGTYDGTTTVNHNFTAEGVLKTNSDLNVAGDSTLTGNLAVNGGSLTTTQTSFDLLNTTATTVNFAGAATNLQLGSSSGTTNVNNNLDVDLDLNVDGGNITTNQITFDLLNTIATTVNFAGDATSLTVGATTGTTNVRNDLDVDGSATVNGALTVDTNATVTGDLAVNGGDLTTNQLAFNLVNTSAETINLGGAATDINIGNATGTTTVNHNLQIAGTTTIGNHIIPDTTEAYDLGSATNRFRTLYLSGNTIDLGAGQIKFNEGIFEFVGGVGEQTELVTDKATFNLVNDTATTINFGGAATNIQMGATTGTTFVKHNLDVAGTLTLSGQSEFSSINVTDLTSGRLVLAGANGELEDSADLTYDGTTLSVNANTVLSGQVQIPSVTALTIPVGTEADKASFASETGQVRFNTTNGQFEGYQGTVWSSLGGVRSVDGLTYITAESSPGASDDTLSFITDGAERLAITTTAADFDATVDVNIKSTTAAASSSTGALVVDGGVGIGGHLFVGDQLKVANNTDLGGDLVIAGNLTVNGTTTTVNSTAVSVDDINIVLGDTASPSDVTANGGGITLKGATDKTFAWNSITSAWTSSENIDVVSGKVYEVGGIVVLSSTEVLGSASIAKLAGNATDLTIGATTGTVTLRNTTVDITNNAEIGGSLDVTGNIAVNTDKFVVTSANGNTAIAGTLTAGSTSLSDTSGSGALTVTGDSLFNGTVNAGTNTLIVGNIDSSGNIDIDGTLGVVGTTTLADVNATTGTFSDQITSTVTTGTAPLVVASTTVVSNLNADKLDGYDASEDNTPGTVVARTTTGDIRVFQTVFSGSSSGTTTLNAENNASGAITLPSATDTLIGKATTDTLTNKTIDLTNNTLSGSFAEFNAALEAGAQGSFASTDGTETLTNKTLTDPTINAGSGAIVLPNTASPAQTSEGSVVWDSDNDLLTVGTGTSRKTMVDLDSTQTLTNKTLANPTFTGASQDFTLTGDVTGSVTVSNYGDVSIATTIAANSVALGTDTTGNYIATITGTTDQITVTGSGSETAAVTLSLPQSIATTSNPSFASVTLQGIQVGVTSGTTIDTNSGNLILDSSGGTVEVNDNLTVAGNLTVNGTTTTVNSTTISVDDKNIELGSVASPTDVTADGGGLTLKGATDKTFAWLNSVNSWTSSEDLNVATGKSYKINGTKVLSSTELGSGVTSSSLTSVGTIGTGTWEGTVISPTYGGTGVNNGTKTITLGGNFTHTGAHTLGLTTTGNTSVTLPTSGTLATTGNLSQFAATTSAQLASIISDETGTGPLVFANAPTLSSPRISTVYGSTLANGTLTLRGTTNGDKSTASVKIDENVTSTSATTGTLVVTGGVGISENLNVAGTIKLDSSAVADVLDLNNNNITGVNNIKFADPGPNEGLEWTGGNVWRIYESPDDLTSNGAGNLQIVQGGTRRATFKTNGILELPVANGTAPLEVASSTLVDNLNADLLDGQEGTYYLDFTNFTNIPDPQVTVTLTGDVTGTANTTLTDLGNGTVSVATTIAANSVALGTDTTGNYVAAVAGTTNQVTVTGSGSESAAVTISLPQDIHTGASPTFAGATLDNIRVGVTAVNEIDTSTGNLIIDSAGGTTTVDDNLIVSGDLTVNGTTTTVNSTTVTIDDPVFTLGGNTVPTSNDSKDRGIEFRWHDGANAKLGFFGYDESTGKFTFIRDASNASEIFSGTKGTVDANIEWSDVLNKPDPTLTIDGDASGTATFTDLGSATLTLTIADDSHNHTTANIDNFDTSVRNLVGGMVSGNSESGIAVTYDAANEKLDFNVNDPTIELTGDITGSATMTNLGNVSISTAIAVNSVELGTNTTGDYVASVASGTGLTGGAASAEGAALTLSLNHLGLETLTDPDADRIFFWDDSANSANWLSLGTGLSLVGTTLTASDRGSSQNIFKTIAVVDTDSGNAWSSAGTVVAESNNDTVTFVDGAGVDLFASPTTDAILIQHSDTSSVANLSSNNSGSTFIQDINFTFDSFGHVTAATVATGTESNDFGTVTVTDSDSGYTWSATGSAVADAVSDTLTVVSGAAMNVDVSSASDAIRISHGDTSSVSNLSSNNSGSTFIQDINFTFDTYGHVTAATVATGNALTSQSSDFGKVTVSDTDSGYTWSATGTATADATQDTVTFVSGTGVNVDIDAGSDAVRFTNSDRGSSQNIFKTIAVSGQTNIVADSNNDTLTFAAGSGIAITTAASTDTVTITHADTSTQASVNNSGATVIQDITLDGFGHITDINSVDLDSRFVNVSGDTMTGSLTINGALNATTKSFVIDHPTKANMKLRYVSLEGPEAGVYVRGRITGETTIELPDYWIGLVDADTITVNLTPVGSFQAVYVTGTDAEKVTIAIDNKPNSDIDCYYTIFAERKDVDKLVVEYEDK